MLVAAHSEEEKWSVPRVVLVARVCALVSINKLTNNMKCPILCALLFLYLPLETWSSRPGIYVDNGFDQTVMDMAITEREKRDMELQFLNLLGLPERPRRQNGNPTLRRSAPRFLMDVYRTLMEEEDETGRRKRSAELNLSGDEQNAINISDVIMTFESIEHHVSGVRHERGKRLWFNVSEVPVAENIVGAELRIYQNANISTKHPNQQFTVSAFQLIRSDGGERELEYISSANTTTSFTGWLGLNLTDCLATWVALPDSNKGLYLSVHPTDRPGHEIRPEDIGLVTVKGADETQPFMVAFLKATNHVKQRQRRDVSNYRRVKKSEYSNLMKNAYGGLGLSMEQEGKNCRIHTLYISFKDLHWEDWIIAPSGYGAYYCSGECKFPLNAHMNATNHAIVQTLVHLMKPLKYPKPCCAPTKLTPISVLYFLDDANVVLKKYKKMVVKSCGCH